jgi:hypothetical protein
VLRRASPPAQERVSWEPPREASPATLEPVSQEPPQQALRALLLGALPEQQPLALVSPEHSLLSLADVAQAQPVAAD